jgi:hypothetical protein
MDVDMEEKPSQEIIRLVAEGLADNGIVADIVDFAEDKQTSGVVLNPPPQLGLGVWQHLAEEG